MKSLHLHGEDVSCCENYRHWSKNTSLQLCYICTHANKKHQLHVNKYFMETENNHFWGYRTMNITQTGRQIIRHRGTTDTAEQCMNVFLTNKNTVPLKFTAGAISGLLHQFEESIPGNGARWCRDRYLMIQSYLTSWHCLGSTSHRGGWAESG